MKNELVKLAVLPASPLAQCAANLSIGTFEHNPCIGSFTVPSISGAVQAVGRNELHYSET